MSRKLLSILALFCLAVTSAWAETEIKLVTIKSSENSEFQDDVKEKDFNNMVKIKFDGDAVYNDGTAGWCCPNGEGTLTVSALPGYTVTRITFTVSNPTPNVTCELTESPFTLYLNNEYTYSKTNQGGTEFGYYGPTSITVYGYANSADDNQAAADVVIGKINAIGTVVYTDECKAKIDDARTAYNALTSVQKNLVTNYGTLTTAETDYNNLKTAADNQAAANAVIAKIDAIGTVEYTAACKAKIDDARTAYNALTSAQKALVTNYTTLTAAEEAYLAAGGGLLVTITAEEDEIDSEGTTFDGKVTITPSGGDLHNDGPDGGWICPDGGTLTITGAQGYTVTRVTFTLSNPETGVTCELTKAPFILYLTSDFHTKSGLSSTDIDFGSYGPTSISVYGRANSADENQAAADVVIGKINAIGTVEYTAACKAKIDDARAAYNALTSDQQALVTNYGTLTQAETDYNNLKTAAENQAAADVVIAKINAIGTVEYTAACKAKIDDARSAYNALTSAQQALVTNYTTLTAAEEAYAAAGGELLATITSKDNPDFESGIRLFGDASGEKVKITLSGDISNEGAVDGWFPTGGGAGTLTVTGAPGYEVSRIEFIVGSTSHELTGSSITLYLYDGKTFSEPNGNGTKFGDGGPTSITAYGHSVSVVPMTDVTLNETSVTMAINETLSLTPTIAPTDASDQMVVWSVTGDAVKLYSNEACSPPTITGIVDAGTVYMKAVAYGTATVRVSSYTDATKYAECTVTVPYPLSETDGITANTAPKIADKPVTFSRTFSTTGKASTICLPLDIDATQAAAAGTFYTFVSIEYDDDGGVWTATMKEANAASPLTANTPYLFLPSTTEVKFAGTAASTISAGSVENGDGWLFQGTYSRLTYGDELFNGNVYGFAAKIYNGDDYTVNSGDFVMAMTGASVPPFRCFLTYNDGEKFSGNRSMCAEEMPNRIAVRLVGLNGQTTAIGSMDAKTGEVTLGDEWYTLDGRKIQGQPSKKGIYVHKGKKVVNK